MSDSAILTTFLSEHAARKRVMFSMALLLATVLPLFVMSIYSVAPRLPGVIPVVFAMVLMGGTHVFSTSYLLTDTAVRRFVASRPIKMGLIPLFMIIGGTLALSRPGSVFFVGAVLAFCLYQTWHFGAQNIGVATLISFSERGKPLSAVEKNLIRLGVICGMLGVLRAMSPGFLVGERNMPITPFVAGLFEHFYIAGRIVACGIAMVALALLIKAWRQQFFMHGLALFLSVTFLFAMYLSRNSIVGYLSFATAHGLQYMIILFWHSLGSPTAKRVRSPLTKYFGATTALLILAVIGHYIWLYSPAISSDSFPLIGAAFILSLTLAHFWIDQYLWRMRDKERAQWLKARYSFIFAH